MVFKTLFIASAFAANVRLPKQTVLQLVIHGGQNGAGIWPLRALDAVGSFWGVWGRYRSFVG